MKRATRFSLLAACFAAMILFPGCGGEKSEEDLILEKIGEIGKYVEKRDTLGIIECLTPDFYDMEDRSRDDVEELIQKYFGRYRGIVFNLLGQKILFVRPPEAEIEVEISLSSGAARLFRKLIRYSGSLYRFKLGLTRVDSGWRIYYAEWRYITLEELFPESFKILKKIFPDI